jgi:hypothetical protein
VFDHLLLLDSSLIVQSAAYAHSGGYYSVPKILKMDLSGSVIDSVWPNIFDVYNQTGNVNLYSGANHTFWAFTYIGTIGVSNEIEITRYDQNLNILLNYYNGAFYDQRYSFNKKGEKGFDVFIDEYDSVTATITQPDHISLSDSAGFGVSDSIYFSLLPSDELLRTEDEGFSLFYSLYDSLVIRHFDVMGLQQHIKYFNFPCYRIYPPVPAADSGYFLVTLDYDIQTNFWAYTVIKFNNADDTIWTQSFSPLYVNSFETIKPTTDGGAIALFRTQHFGDSTNYLVRLGPNGERFPFTLQMNPHIFCTGDTVTLSTIQNAANYRWDTGDSTATLRVTTSGNYGLTVSDTAGNLYYVRPVAVQFESIQQVVQNDVHSCLPSIQLTQSAPNATTFWSNDRFGYATGAVGYYSSSIIPDTMQIWIMEQTAGGCRTIDSAFIFFDDCSGIPVISNQENKVVIKIGTSSVTIQSTQLESLFKSNHAIAVRPKLQPHSSHPDCFF